MGRCGIDASGSDGYQLWGSAEYFNEPSGAIKGGEFLD